MEFLQEEFDEILNIFSSESEEIIQRINNNLLALEKKPHSKELIINLFRDAHSLKGAARMVGFNNLQKIAHKIEDILELAQEDKLTVNQPVCDILLKAVDFCLLLIQKSIIIKKEFETDEINVHEKLLESVISSKGIIEPLKELPAKRPDKPENFDKFEVNISDSTAGDESEDTTRINEEEISIINAVLTEFLFILINFERFDKSNSLNVLSDLLSELLSFFDKHDFFSAKEIIVDIKSKIDLTLNGTGDLDKSEIENIEGKIGKFIVELEIIFKQASAQVPDYWSLAQVKASQGEHKQEPEEKDNMFPEPHFDEFRTESNDENSIDGFIERVEKLKKRTQNPKVQSVYAKISDILLNLKTHNLDLTNEVAIIIKQSLKATKTFSEAEENDSIEDLDLIIQRLSVIEQMGELEISDSSFLGLRKSNIEPKFQKAQDFFKAFETGSIKTLRVDTLKLDYLVNQVGELIVNKIKTKAHLKTMEGIKSDIEEWHNLAHRSLGYFKHYEKKTSFNENDIENILAFNKYLFSSFSHSLSTTNEIMDKVSNLYRQVQEDDAKFSTIAENLESVVKNVRILPLATVFHMFPRMVRDISMEKGKEIELFISGSQTSADKKIIEDIKTPLIHIVRNAIDHGIETPEQRIANNKPPVGQIHLSAEHRDNKIIIEVKDDGKGVNFEKIKEKALEKGLLSQKEIDAMTDEQIMDLIFHPGFSTGEEVTDISGRGIGLDVVSTKISQLNGKVKVYSVLGHGTKVLIELPTTMATLKSFIVSLNEQNYAFALSSIKTALWVEKENILFKDGHNNIVFENEIIPIVELAEILGLERTENETKREIIVIVETENNKIGYIVDGLVGDQEILQKKFSPPIFKLKNISGVTTIASGETCLILNISDIIKSAFTKINNSIFSKNNKLQKMLKKEYKNEDYSILILDDSATTRTLLKNVLKGANFNIAIALNPQNALDMLDEQHFDLIVSDIEMPVMNGYEFIERVKSNKITCNIPIIVLSSLNTEKARKKSLRFGASEHIYKSDFNQQVFLKIICDTLKKTAEKV